MIKASDISTNLSGGTNNADPELSLGGDPSVYDVTTGLQNLFANVTAEEALAGLTDYRCFYVFNNSLTDTFYNVYLYFENYLDSVPQLSLGLNLANDTQKITISGEIDSGNIILRYGDSPYYYTGNIDWGGSYTQFRENIQNALNSIGGLTGVQVLADNIGSVYNFEIVFTNNDGNKYHPNLYVQNNNLVTVSAATPTIVITKIVNGSPINTIPDLVEPYIAPLGVVFYNSSSTNVKDVGTLLPSEGFPVWVKRIIPINSDPSSASGATFKIKGGSLP